MENAESGNSSGGSTPLGTTDSGQSGYIPSVAAPVYNG